MPSKTKSGTVYIEPTQDEGQSHEEERKLDELAESANLIIFEATSQRPFLLPNKDKITITPNRVTVTSRGIFSTDEFPMPVENITGARVYTHVLFASLSIDTFGMEKPKPISHMKKDQARLARRYILALVEAKKAGVDLIGLDLHELKEKLKNLGTVRFSTNEKDYHNL